MEHKFKLIYITVATPVIINGRYYITTGYSTCYTKLANVCTHV